MKFKVGDRVKSEEFGYGKIVESKRNNENNCISFLVKFDKKDFLLHNGNGLSINKYKKNTCYWYRDYFAESQLELVERKYIYEDLKKAPIGTKITFEDGKTLVKVGNDDINDSFTDINASRSIRDLKGLKDSWLEGYFGKITKIEEPEYTTVYESKPEILDEVEKRYLRNVIRPFRDKIKYIIKVKSSYDNNFYIRIVLNNDVSTLPYFKKNTMYKGMKIDKEYTLEELGL